jgi:hypothetical protein
MARVLARDQRQGAAGSSGLAGRRSCSGQSNVRGQTEEQRDTNGDHTFDRARREENKIHCTFVVGFAYANLTVTPCPPKSPAACPRPGK